MDRRAFILFGAALAVAPSVLRARSAGLRLAPARQALVAPRRRHESLRAGELVLGQVGIAGAEDAQRGHPAGGPAPQEDLRRVGPVPRQARGEPARAGHVGGRGVEVGMPSRPPAEPALVPAVEPPLGHARYLEGADVEPLALLLEPRARVRARVADGQRDVAADALGLRQAEAPADHPAPVVTGHVHGAVHAERVEDRDRVVHDAPDPVGTQAAWSGGPAEPALVGDCLLYTSDAADE